MTFLMASSIFFKFILLQVILFNVSSSMVVDIDEYTKPSNENVLTLFNKFLEEINNRRVFESSNNRVEQIKNLYDGLAFMPPSHNRMIQALESINSEKKNENDLMPPMYQENSRYNNNGYDSNGKDKRRYKTICHFKICNKK